jgi:hypothetical protein
MPILQRSHAPAQQSIPAEIDRQQRDTDLDRRCQKAVVDLPPDLGHFGQADIIQRENLVERAAAIGQRMQAAIEAMAKDIEAIRDIRGRGVLHGVELVEDRDTKEPASDLYRAVVAQCQNDGLLVQSRGSHDRSKKAA